MTKRRSPATKQQKEETSDDTESRFRGGDRSRKRYADKQCGTDDHSMNWPASCECKGKSKTKGKGGRNRPVTARNHKGKGKGRDTGKSDDEAEGRPDGQRGVPRGMCGACAHAGHWYAHEKVRRAAKKALYAMHPELSPDTDDCECNARVRGRRRGRGKHARSQSRSRSRACRPKSRIACRLLDLHPELSPDKEFDDCFCPCRCKNSRKAFEYELEEMKHLTEVPECSCESGSGRPRRQARQPVHDAGDVPHRPASQQPPSQRPKRLRSRKKRVRKRHKLSGPGAGSGGALYDEAAGSQTSSTEEELAHVEDPETTRYLEQLPRCNVLGPQFVCNKNDSCTCVADNGPPAGGDAVPDGVPKGVQCGGPDVCPRDYTCVGANAFDGTLQPGPPWQMEQIGQIGQMGQIGGGVGQPAPSAGDALCPQIGSGPCPGLNDGESATLFTDDYFYTPSLAPVPVSGLGSSVCPGIGGGPCTDVGPALGIVTGPVSGPSPASCPGPVSVPGPVSGPSAGPISNLPEASSGGLGQGFGQTATSPCPFMGPEFFCTGGAWPPQMGYEPAAPEYGGYPLSGRASGPPSCPVLGEQFVCSSWASAMTPTAEEPGQLNSDSRSQQTVPLAAYNRSCPLLGPDYVCMNKQMVMERSLEFSNPSDWWSHSSLGSSRNQKGRPDDCPVLGPKYECLGPGCNAKRSGDDQVCKCTPDLVDDEDEDDKRNEVDDACPALGSKYVCSGPGCNDPSGRGSCKCDPSMVDNGRGRRVSGAKRSDTRRRTSSGSTMTGGGGTSGSYSESGSTLTGSGGTSGTEPYSMSVSSQADSPSYICPGRGGGGRSGARPSGGSGGGGRSPSYVYVVPFEQPSMAYYGRLQGFVVAFEESSANNNPFADADKWLSPPPLLPDLGDDEGSGAAGAAGAAGTVVAMQSAGGGRGGGGGGLRWINEQADDQDDADEAVRRWREAKRAAVMRAEKSLKTLWPRGSQCMSTDESFLDAFSQWSPSTVSAAPSGQQRKPRVVASRSVSINAERACRSVSYYDGNAKLRDAGSEVDADVWLEGSESGRASVVLSEHTFGLSASMFDAQSSSDLLLSATVSQPSFRSLGAQTDFPAYFVSGASAGRGSRAGSPSWLSVDGERAVQVAKESAMQTEVETQVRVETPRGLVSVCTQTPNAVANPFITIKCTCESPRCPQSRVGRAPSAAPPSKKTRCTLYGSRPS